MGAPNKAPIQGQAPDDPPDLTPGSLGVNDKAERNATKPTAYADLFPTAAEGIAIMDRDTLQRSIRQKAVDSLVDEGMPEFKAVNKVDRAIELIRHTADASGTPATSSSQAQAMASAKADELKQIGTDLGKQAAQAVAKSAPVQALKQSAPGQAVTYIASATEDLADEAAEQLAAIAHKLGYTGGSDPKTDNSDKGVFATKEDGSLLIGVYYVPSTGP